MIEVLCGLKILFVTRINPTFRVYVLKNHSVTNKYISYAQLASVREIFIHMLKIN